MALGKALVIGAIAAIGIPHAMHGDSGQLGEWLRRGLADFTIMDVTILWSWPLFAVVTLFAWGFLAWANK